MHCGSEALLELQQSQAASQGQPRIVHCCSKAREELSALVIGFVMLMASLSDSRTTGVGRVTLVSTAPSWGVGTGMEAPLLLLFLLEPGTRKQRGAGQPQRGLP